MYTSIVYVCMYVCMYVYLYLCIYCYVYYCQRKHLRQKPLIYTILTYICIRSGIHTTTLTSQCIPAMSLHLSVTAETTGNEVDSEASDFF